MHAEALNRLNPSGETIQVGSTRIRFLVTGADSEGSVAIFEMGVPSGEQIPSPYHSHDSYEETIYGVEGVTTWTVNGKPIDVRPGQALCIRRGEVHGFANNGEIDALALAVVSPAVIGPEFFREISAILSTGLDPATARAKIGETMRHHGLTPVPPAAAG
ncbi:MAG TPA: cupin domain-containing protein [Nitrolancea sp.]